MSGSGEFLEMSRAAKFWIDGKKYEVTGKVGSGSFGTVFEASASQPLIASCRATLKFGAPCKTERRHKTQWASVHERIL